MTFDDSNYRSRVQTATKSLHHLFCFITLGCNPRLMILGAHHFQSLYHISAPGLLVDGYLLLLLREEKRRELIVDERERGPYGPYIHSTGDKRTNERTNERTQQKTNERHDESRRLSDKSKETSRTTGNLENSHDRPVLPPHLPRCSYNLLECSIMLDHSQRVCKKETDGRIVSQQLHRALLLFESSC
jgi:hypothetical protein